MSSCQTSLFIRGSESRCFANTHSRGTHLVAEVLSPSTAVNDVGRKFAKYEEYAYLLAPFCREKSHIDGFDPIRGRKWALCDDPPGERRYAPTPTRRHVSAHRRYVSASILPQRTCPNVRAWSILTHPRAIVL